MSARVTRGLWFVGGWLAVGVGAIGVIVPGLPSTGFFIIAAACFSRSSPRFERWVLDLPGVGPMVRDYRAGLGMPRAAKLTAVSSIAVVCSVSAFLAITAVWVRVPVLALGAVGIYWILGRVPTRPVDPPIVVAPAGRRFAAAAVAEAVTWLGLFVGMLVKYVGSGNERGVQVFGMVHGVVALVYVAVAVHGSRELRWSGRTLITALLASVPPGGTLVFEHWAWRTGQLSAPQERPRRDRVTVPPGSRTARN